MTVNQGSSSSSTVIVASMNGFDLATGLEATISASGVSWLTATLNPTVVTPSSGGTASSVLTVSASPSTAPGPYTVQIISSGGTKSHTTTVSVTVAAANFSIASLPYPVQVWPGSYNTTLVTFTSLAAFTGNVSISATTALNGLSVSGSPSSVHLTPGTAAVSTVVILAATALPGNYVVTVTGTSGTLSHSLQIAVSVLQYREALSIDSYSFLSSTNVTLYIRNTGTIASTLASYYVKDASGDQYAYLAWSGPTITVNQVVQTLFQIGSSCGSSCTLTGNPFTFTPGYSYTIIVVTSRGNQFAFPVTR